MASQYKTPILQVDVSPALLDRARADLGSLSDGLPLVVSRAINKALAQGKTFVVDELFKLLAIKKRGNILRSQGGKPRLVVEMATRHKREGQIRILGRPIALINFEVKDTRNKKTNTGEGVYYRKYRSDPRRRLPSAFIARGKQGNKHVFERFTGAGRHPIYSHIGLSLYQVVTRDHPEVLAGAYTKVQSVFEAQVLSQVDRMLNRRRADRPT